MNIQEKFGALLESSNLPKKRKRKPPTQQKKATKKIFSDPEIFENYDPADLDLHLRIEKVKSDNELDNSDKEVFSPVRESSGGKIENNRKKFGSLFSSPLSIFSQGKEELAEVLSCNLEQFNKTPLKKKEKVSCSIDDYYDYSKLIENYESEDLDAPNFQQATDTHISSFESVPSTPEKSRLQVVNTTIQANIESNNQKQFKVSPIQFKKGGMAEKYNKSWKQRNAASLLWMYEKDYQKSSDTQCETIVIEQFAVLYGNILVQFKFDEDIFKRGNHFMFLAERFQKIIEVNKKYEVCFGNSSLNTESGKIYFPGNYIRAVKS